MPFPFRQGLGRKVRLLAPQFSFLIIVAHLRKIQQEAGTRLSNDFYLKIFETADEMAKIKKQDFECIEEWHNKFQYGCLVGIIHLQKLAQSDWWKHSGISLIAYSDAVVADID